MAADKPKLFRVCRLTPPAKGGAIFDCPTDGWSPLRASHRPALLTFASSQAGGWLCAGLVLAQEIDRLKSMRRIDPTIVKLVVNRAHTSSFK
jgi:hypothetical protein